MVRRQRKSGKIILRGDEAKELKSLRARAREEAQRTELRTKRRKIARINFSRSKTGTIGRVVSNIPGQISRGRLRVGRPKGSYDNRYAKYGGVYGYRRLLTSQLRGQRLQQLRENTLTPEQQQLLAQAAQRQQARNLDPEQRTIPDSNGKFDFRAIMKEIEDASNIAG